jgi:hypothetical protein
LKIKDIKTVTYSNLRRKLDENEVRQEKETRTGFGKAVARTEETD